MKLIDALYLGALLGVSKPMEAVAITSTVVSLHGTKDSESTQEGVRELFADYQRAQEGPLKNFLKGEWEDTELVQRNLGISFTTGLRLFEFSREACWWSICGKTEEERARHGQCIVTKFRLRRDDDGKVDEH